MTADRKHLRVWPVLPLVSVVTGGRGPRLALGGVGLATQSAKAQREEFSVHPDRWPPFTEEMKADCTLPDDFLATLLRRHLEAS